MQTNQHHPRHRIGTRDFYPGPVLGLLLAATLAMPALQAGEVDSGSTGVDGALIMGSEFDEQTSINFTPAAIGLDANHTNTYHFTSIHIRPNTTVRMSAQFLGAEPIVWLAQDEVLIEGTLDLDGEAVAVVAAPSVS